MPSVQNFLVSVKITMYELYLLPRRYVEDAAYVVQLNAIPTLCPLYRPFSSSSFSSSTSSSSLACVRCIFYSLIAMTYVFSTV